MGKLAIDLTYQPVGGSLAQIIEIIKNVDAYRFDKVIFYIVKENRHLFEGYNDKKIILKIVPFSNTSIFLRTFWAQFLLPFLLKLDGIDVLFCPGNISPIFSIVKKVQWIGTVGPFENDFIAAFPWKQKIVLFVSKYLIVFSARTSDTVIFESNYTKNLFIKKYRQPTKTAVVLHIGNDDFFRPVASLKSSVSHKIKNQQFILTVSHLYPYKDIETLIRSFNHLQLSDQGLVLCIAGSVVDEAYYAKLIILIQKYDLEEYVIFLGRVGREDLKELYSQCKAFVFTSPFENFAYTLVEAMGCGAPIIATNSTAMPETCGAAALYFSPGDELELSACLLKYLVDEPLRLSFKEKALLKSNEFDVYQVVNKKTNDILEALVYPL
jgi:glycosyltransferase involved in cell wall biosynthesis